MGDFVIGFIRLLNYGHDDESLRWGIKNESIDQNKRAKQVEQVGQLFELVCDRAQLSEYHIGFDYTDEDSELEYALENGDCERLCDLRATIFSCEDHLYNFLTCDSIPNWFAEIMIKHWLDTLTFEQTFLLNKCLKEIDENRFQNIYNKTIEALSYYLDIEISHLTEQMAHLSSQDNPPTAHNIS